MIKGYNKQKVHVAFAVATFSMLIIGIFIGYLAFGVHPTEPFEYIQIEDGVLHVYHIGYFHNSLGHSFPFLDGDMKSYSHAFQMARDDIMENAKRGNVWEGELIGATNDMLGIKTDYSGILLLVASIIGIIVVLFFTRKIWCKIFGFKLGVKEEKE